ncbi:hypothetical protein [Streptomyces sp. NBC_00557]|uniref:hypothetical protein n=1 Tax=Streptomyces sp. NBC_00557 TaxID=2975776 RepID=UPI002E812B0C|nr:hypothetical protein [Streptomyces sp. NBC_00557]WUC36886.1 hypothetical protein OG956_23060 [Streptomyces sp. NBC_00557]
MRAEEISRWIADHNASITTVELASAFDAHLRTLPWAGHGIDWRDLPCRSLKLHGVSDDDVVDWARTTPLGAHDHVLLIDSASEPGVICSFEDALRDFELLSSRPELYMCGVDLSGALPQPSFRHFIERRTFMTLNARL